MQTLFSELTSFAREAGEAEITGEVRAITGITLTAVGLERVLGIGERCIVHGSDGPESSATELALFFSEEGDLIDWTPDVTAWVYSQEELS